MKSNFSRIKKGYTVVGLILLLMLLTVWGWYLKTNQIEVFDAGDPPADPALRTEAERSVQSITISRQTRLYQCHITMKFCPNQMGIWTPAIGYPMENRAGITAISRRNPIS